MSKEVSGRLGKPRASERWPESSGRSLDDAFLIEVFSCEVWSFFVLRLQVARGEVELRLGSFLEVRGRLELRDGGLRALEEAWMTTSRLGNFSVKFRCVLGF